MLQNAQFRWEVNDPAGYCWVEVADLEKDASEQLVSVAGTKIPTSRADELAKDSDTPNLFLVQRPGADTPNQPLSQRRYEPQQFTGLYLMFKELTPCPTAIQYFANRFGFLMSHGHPPLRIAHLDYDGVDRLLYVPGWYGNNIGIHGEHFTEWKEEILSVQEAVTIWKAARSGNPDVLSQYIYWRPPSRNFPDGEPWFRSKIRRYCYHPRLLNPPLQDHDSEPVWLYADPHTFSPGDLVEPALVVVSRIVTLAMERRVPTGLTFQPGTDTHPRLSGVPKDLLAVIWQQFANAVAGDKEYKDCEFCGDPFEVGPGAANRNRRFCSDSHRKAFKRRQLRKGF